MSTQEERNKKALEFGIKYASKPPAFQKPIDPETRFNANITSREGFAAIEEYFLGRAEQLLWVGFRLETVARTDYGGIAIWHSASESRNHASPYLYLEHRGRTSPIKYRDICRHLCMPILTIDDCNISGFLDKNKITHSIVSLPAEYRLIEQYYHGKTAKRTGYPYIRHIDRGLRKLRDMTLKLPPNKMPSELAVQLLRVFMVHPIYQDNNQEWMAKHAAISSDEDVQLVKEYTQLANAYLPKDLNVKKPPIISSAIMNLLLLADKVQNYEDFSLNQIKFSKEKVEQLSAYFDNWFSALLNSVEHPNGQN